MKQHIIQGVRDKLKNKKIVLFGANDDTRTFFENNHKVLNISHCVTNNVNESTKAFSIDMPKVRPFTAAEISSDVYFVICGPIAFRSIELQLNHYGLKMYDDYIESSIAEAILSNKKIALFYGLCILRDTYNSITRIPAFNQEYYSIFTTNTGQQAITTNRLLYYAKDLCDLYIYSPKVIDRDRLYNIYPEDLPSDCTIHSIPNLQFPLYWPQINVKGGEYNDYYLFPYNINRDLTYGHTLYRRSDENINKMLKSGMSVSEIVDTLSDENFYSEKAINRWRDMTFKMLGMGENDVTVKIYDYMEHNYRTTFLFQNFLHPHKDVIWTFVRRLLANIGISPSEADIYYNTCPKYIHHGGDVPVYPSVIRHLNLDCLYCNSSYEVMTGSGLEIMNFREYIEHFAEYTLRTMKLKNML